MSGLPAPLAELVGSCLAKDPGERPDLERLLDRFAALASAEEGTGEAGGWLPEDLTEVIGRHRTLTLSGGRPATKSQRPELSRVPVGTSAIPSGGSRLSLAEERAHKLGWGYLHQARTYQYTVYVPLGIFTLLSVITLAQVLITGEADWLFSPGFVYFIHIPQIVVGVVLVVAWLLWFQRVRATAEALEPGRLRFPSSMAVYGWFIPIANFFLPQMIATDIWHASSQPRADGRMESFGLVHIWWVLWSVTFLTLLTWPIFWFSQDLFDMWDQLIVRVVAIPSAIAAALFVHRLTAMQAARLNT
ncbi:DUF4328 domain-containing protein [Nocardiopsis sp. JB363]|uniref:DUF4328 domain-containing protein n=1 Tax=Nocardiopsis sp. JB363 TaxID=1434837 RepID=UPI00097A89CA|nr:DUF4328 domain-containing protein [Nocardiopsis sp. JB363]SIO90176.1 putative serine/threonine protein kinase [Nocardiopsis sp. JB363]